jgi:hypothetical protein
MLPYGTATEPPVPWQDDYCGSEGPAAYRAGEKIVIFDGDDVSAELEQAISIYREHRERDEAVRRGSAGAADPSCACCDAALKPGCAVASGRLCRVCAVRKTFALP